MYSNNFHICEILFRKFDSIAPKEETIVFVELTRKQKEYYRAILERNVEYLKRGAKSSNVRCRSVVAQLTCCHVLL